MREVLKVGKKSVHLNVPVIKTNRNQLNACPKVIPRGFYWVYFSEFWLITYHFHAERAVVDGLVLDVDVHQWTRVRAAVAGAKSGRHKGLVAHGCRGRATHLWTTRTRRSVHAVGM